MYIQYVKKSESSSASSSTSSNSGLRKGVVFHPFCLQSSFRMVTYNLKLPKLKFRETEFLVFDLHILVANKP